MVFGKKLAQREFSNLQNGSKLLKPASLNKLLGKRSWKLEKIPELLFKQKNLKIEKIERSQSLNHSASCIGVDIVNSKLNPQNKSRMEEKRGEIDSEGKRHRKFNQQLRISRPGLKEFATADNIEDYFLYNLSKSLLDLFALIQRKTLKMRIFLFFYPVLRFHKQSPFSLYFFFFLILN